MYRYMCDVVRQDGMEMEVGEEVLGKLNGGCLILFLPDFFRSCLLGDWYAWGRGECGVMRVLVNSRGVVFLPIYLHNYIAKEEYMFQEYRGEL